MRNYQWLAIALSSMLFACSSSETATDGQTGGAAGADSGTQQDSSAGGNATDSGSAGSSTDSGSDTGAAGATTDSGSDTDAAGSTTDSGSDGSSTDASDADIQDAPNDAPADIDIPDTGTNLSGKCKAAGGVLCTSARWTPCPEGFEPVEGSGGNISQGCKMEGNCCQPAPVSSCTKEQGLNCLPGDKCPPCWSDPQQTNMKCETGRTCCRYTCK